MIRIKRLLSSFIDFVIIFMGMDVFHTYLLKGVTSKNTIEIIFNVIFLIFTFNRLCLSFLYVIFFCAIYCFLFIRQSFSRQNNA